MALRRPADVRKAMQSVPAQLLLGRFETAASPFTHGPQPDRSEPSRWVRPER